MHSVKRYGSLLRNFVAFSQSRNLASRYLLTVDQAEFTAPPLYSVAMNVCPLFFDVQNEPQLEAGVGHCREDAALASFVDGSG